MKPKVFIIPHTAEGPPLLVVERDGGYEAFPFDITGALYHTKVLNDWLYSTLHKGDGVDNWTQGTPWPGGK